MTEPDVALTDYLLALECLLFGILLARRGAWWSLSGWFAVYFFAGTVASACGGTVHGFFHDEQSTGYLILWCATLLAIGVATLAAWIIGGKLLFSPAVVRWIVVAAAVQLAAYSLVVLFVNQDFVVAIADNLPAVLFLIVAFLWTYRRERHAVLLVAAGGLSLTLVAAALQQFQIALDPRYFNHNAVFHVVQAVALVLLFLGCRSFLADGRPPTPPATDGYTGSSRTGFSSVPIFSISIDR
jgi:hypothetical protein